MRLVLVVSAFLTVTNSVVAFSPSCRFAVPTALKSTVAAANGAEVKARMEENMGKMKIKDATSKNLAKEDLTVVYEDEHIVVINKPSGVLCVPGKESNPSLSQAVFDSFGSESGRADKMVVHRLGMDTSGLVVFARTNAALSKMNILFRSRRVNRKYEALVCGHIEEESGVINMPLMTDYENPPYMRISTHEHQTALLGLEVEDVGKKLLANPKDSLTEYTVIAKEDLGDNAVTRVELTSVSGRTHQLNVHCAAFGHAIVADKVYGINGEANINGGLDEGTSPSRASVELQEKIAAAAGDMPMCVHAKSISFEHPVTREKLSFDVPAPF